jgi:5-methylcytosine-specific restriction enzyme subunit McrC
MTTSRILDLREDEIGRFPREMISDGEVWALKNSDKFEVEAASIFNQNTYGIRSRGWIGQIPIGDDLLIRVVPKVPVGNLFRMLEVAYNLRSFRLFDGEIAIESLDDVYERIVSILSRRVLDRVRKGLYRSYLDDAEDLPYVRGHIDVVGVALNSMRGVPRIPCRYQEHTADLDDNRILLWTLQQVRHQGLQQTKVRIELDRARRALGGTITLAHFSSTDCVYRFYHRLNDDYAPMHGLCRFILEQAGPGIQAGDRTFIPFQLYMPNLFESFVAEWLRANAPKGVTVRPQHTAKLDANFEMKMHVDIVLCDEVSQQAIAVLDTKYKASEQPSEADIYQVAFYAKELHVTRAMLVYPSPLASPFRMRHGKDILLESLVFDVSKSPDIAGASFLDVLNARLASQSR